MRTNAIGHCNRAAHPQLLARLSPRARPETGPIRTAIIQFCRVAVRRDIE